jgi:hypothetical protein
MTVIEADGTSLQPLVVDSLEIFAGASGPKSVICSINQRQNRSTLLGCCRMLFFTLAQDCVTYIMLLVCRSLRTSQLPTTVRVLSIISSPN